MFLRSLRIAIAIVIPIPLFISIFILTACASSNVTRDVSSNIDMGVRNGNNLANSLTEGSLADSYQNSSQTAKGAVFGGIAGGITGAMSSGIGVVEGAAIGMILGGSYGAYIDANTTLNDQLENRGITTIVLGDHILIMIPSARLFYQDSSQIKPPAYSTLKLVTRLINRYTKMLVKINAYTADTGSPRVSQALSQRQAESILRFLSASGVDARLLYAQGCGGSHLVVGNTREWDSDNYRIEITLKKLYV